MKTLKLSSKKLFKVLLNMLLLRKKKFYVAGMRRSGNHAFVNWLKNALEAENVSFDNPGNEKKFHVTPSGNTVFINHLNKISNKNYFRMIFNNFFIIAKSKNIIISTEDYTCKNCFRVPVCNHYFLVKRSLLNLIASRYKKVSDGLQNGRCLEIYNIDKNFFNTLKKLYTTKDYISWEFDEWLLSSEYRRLFLKQLNLNFDSRPDVSKQGGGSSFIGYKLPEKKDLLERYKLLDLPSSIIENLYQSDCADFLTDDEKNYLAKNYHTQ